MAFTRIKPGKVINKARTIAETIVYDGVKFGVGAVPAYLESKSRGHGEIVSMLIGAVTGFITKVPLDTMEGMQVSKKVLDSTVFRHHANYVQECSKAIEEETSQLNFLRLTSHSRKQS